jgi:hypothetical protein
MAAIGATSPLARVSAKGSESTQLGHSGFALGTALHASERTLGYISLIQINADCGDGELMRPAELAVEKSGNVIVVDSGNNRLQFFKPDGTFVGKCGRAGKGDGEFNALGPGTAIIGTRAAGAAGRHRDQAGRHHRLDPSRLGLNCNNSNS